VSGSRPLSTAEIAREVALDLSEGSYVNLGIGMPTRVAAHVPSDRDVILHSENGILGMAPLASEDGYDPDLIDASKRGVALRRGGAYVSHADSFAIIRGGHIDVAVMGAYQVSAAGDLANWSNGATAPGVGGAMDLAVGAGSVFVMMRHVDRSGNRKIVPELTLPATGWGVVRRIYTEYGIFELDGGVLAATALAPVDPGVVAAHTAIPVRVAPDCVPLPRPG
jgi:3-oxoadipate CoA-transferase beta subunit